MGSMRGQEWGATGVVLHVGTPKTGATYPQSSMLWRSRELAR